MMCVCVCVFCIFACLFHFLVNDKNNVRFMWPFSRVMISEIVNYAKINRSY